MIYLQPSGIIWGQAAAAAFEAKAALPLAGGPAHFLAAELIEGTPDSHRRRFISLPELMASGETAISQLLQKISARRPPIAGIDFGRPLIMGIVNVTPDSFSDGGELASAEAAASHARKLTAEGADLIDIGGESTRPGAAEVAADEEIRRIAPVLEMLTDLSVPISIDTRKPAVMEAAAEKGAAIINDVSALGYDARSLEVAARLDRPIILMHAQGDPRTMQRNPQYDDVVLDVYDYLAARIAAAENAGIARSKLIADPGIGFGKTLEHNLALMRSLSIFHGLGVPILLGASRKRFIGDISGVPEAKQRMPGSVGAALAAASQGVQVLRVHDVKETRQALQLWLASMTGQAISKTLP